MACDSFSGQKVVYLLLVAILASSGDSRSFGVLGRHFSSAQFGNEWSVVALSRKLSLAVYKVSYSFGRQI